MKNNGVQQDEITIEEPAIRDIVRYYTREAGVRALEREISKICRKVVKKLLAVNPAAAKRRSSKAAGSHQAIERVTVTAENLSDFLGVRRFSFGMAEKENKVGQVTGLAWTDGGGGLLRLEERRVGKGVVSTGRSGGAAG